MKLNRRQISNEKYHFGQTRTKISGNIEKKEKKAAETARKVQEMQASLQAAAADAARAIAAQNS